MEFLLLPLALTALVIGLSFLLYCLQKHTLTSRTNNNITTSAPEPSGAWPIIGHLLIFDSTIPIYRNLAILADKCGPVFKIQLGMRHYLVVNNHEAVKECFTTNDLIFASRPSSAAGRYMGYNYAGFGFAPYGLYWRETRKLAMVELLSSRSLESLKHSRTSEVEMFIRDLYSCASKNDDGGGKTVAKVVMISENFDHLTINILSRMIAGKRYFGVRDEAARDDDEEEEAEKFRMTIKKFMQVSASSVLSDLIPVPFLEWLDLKGYIKEMKRIHEELEPIVQRWIDEHQAKRMKNESDREQDFLDVMISAMEKGVIPSDFTKDTIMKATTENIFLAGSETTAVTMTWLLSLLLNNDHALRRVQEEIDQKVGKERWVEDSDIKDLVYLQAVLKETLRLYPPGPLGVPHVASQDCHVSGYHIPKGTRLMVNIWKLHRDPRIWINPEEFNPERFLTCQKMGSVDVSGRCFEFIPFGSGRRSCPGITLALLVIHLSIARLVQGFDLSRPMNMPIDMKEGRGITLPKANPLEVAVSPRLHPKLYPC